MHGCGHVAGRAGDNGCLGNDDTIQAVLESRSYLNVVLRERAAAHGRRELETQIEALLGGVLTPGSG